MADRLTIYQQIYERVRNSIAEGRLRPGDRLPSARSMAAELGVARGTVDTAYAMLSGEGFVVSRGREGTVVSPDLLALDLARRSGAQGSAEALQSGSPFAVGPLTPGLPAFDLFPRKLWSQLVARQARRLGPDDLAYPDPAGSLALRRALAAYLAVARGIDCTAEQILVTGGYQAALGLLCRVLLERGSPVWVEDPGYLLTRWALKWVGANPTPVAVDAEGLDVEAGLRTAPDAAMCVVAPAHQFPTGASMSLRRRLALLEWARASGGWIVEDDYDGEFRFQGRPQPALKSLDGAERVFYVGTFSKTMFPGLRLGYVVAPAVMVRRCRQALHLLDGGRPALEQAAVAEFLAEGHFARHLKRMRSAYRTRRDALASEIGRASAGRLEVQPTIGGLHLVAQVCNGRDADLAERAGRAGLRPLPMSSMSARPEAHNALLIGFAGVPEPQAAAMAQRLEAAFG
ncbi:MAG: PLP-dependent aminotransferase family protein [Caulobacteraceae bacterium]